MTTRSVFGASAPPGTYAQHTDGTPSIVLGTCFYCTATQVGATITGGRLWVPPGVGGGTATCTLRVGVKATVNNLDTAAVQTKSVTWAGDTKWVDAVFDVAQPMPDAGVRWMIAWQQADPIRYNSALDFRVAPGAAVPAADGSPIVLAEFDQPSGPLGPVRDRYFRFGTDAPGVSGAQEGGYATDTLVDIPTGPSNAAPVAEAGLNRTVFAGTLVTLDGSASTDSDGGVVAWFWSQVSGPAVTLAGSGSSRTFTPTDPGTYLFSLSVTDDDGASSALDTVTITVQAIPVVVPVGTGPDLSAGVAAVEALMDDRCIVYPPSDPDSWVMGPDLRLVPVDLVPTYGSEAAPAPCKIRAGGAQSRQEEQGGAPLDVSVYTFDIPLGAPAQEPGSTVVVVSSRRMPTAVGTRLTLGDPVVKTLAVQARYEAKRNKRVAN